MSSSAGATPTIAVLGDHDPELFTHRELDAALGRFPAWARAGWVETDSDAARALADVDGLWVVPGSPYRDDDAVLAAIGHARRHGVPLLGTCGGFQYTVLEFARGVTGLDAAHAETDPDAAAPVIAPLGCSLVGQERTVTCVPGTRLAQICGDAPFTGFHWCGYGLAERFVTPLSAAGLVVSARAEDAGVEGVELPGHPFFMATLFQPQVGAGRGGPLHPLLLAFLAAAGAHAGARAAAPA